MGAAVVIPARLESTRLPRKLLLAETGRPLIAHTVERVLEAQAESEGAITRVLVAADDSELVDAARAAGAEAVMTQDEDMGTVAYPIVSREDFMSPHLVKVVLDRRGRALYFSRAPAPFPREGRPLETHSLREGEWGLGHLGIYVYRKSLLLRYAELPRSSLEAREKLEQLRALEAGVPIRVAIVSPPLGRAVDTREDYDEFRRRIAAEGRIA